MSTTESQDQEQDKEMLARYDNQVGPMISGTGSIAIYTQGRPVALFYSPQDESRARVLYNTNFSRPDKPLPVRQELPIRGATNVYIDYDVQPGGDIKVAWALR